MTNTPDPFNAAVSQELNVHFHSSVQPAQSTTKGTMLGAAQLQRHPFSICPLLSAVWIKGAWVSGCTVVLLGNELGALLSWHLLAPAQQDTPVKDSRPHPIEGLSQVLTCAAPLCFRKLPVSGHCALSFLALL